ncbi:CPBP family intramembrane glutamic endopeptidase [Hyphobacterium sp.]|uniref:CPBP family intramembrane glutamic endopeptidase n=1 Tax=Hyphobacterium sp. TaxID=2004662 RepID=UPI003BAD6304
MSEPKHLKPMGLVTSSLIFFIPAFLTFLLLVPGRDAVIAMGYEPRTAFLMVGAVAFGMLFFVTAGLYIAEGHRWTWRAFKERLRLKRMTGKEWAATLLLAVFMTAVYLGLLFAGTREWIAQYIPIPAWYSGEGETNSPMLGAYWIIWARLGLFVLNIFGEELLWRGMLLPRQELAHGRWAWLIHGTQWTLYHAWKPWELLMLWPGDLALAAVCQWTKSTTPGIVAHAIFNFIPIVLVTLVVFGVIG